MIKPTVGRVVWYYQHGAESIQSGAQPNAAIIAHVHNDRMINITRFDANGIPHGLTSVPLLQDDDPAPSGPGAECCTWMPYQTGQAAKTEALEKKLANTEAERQ